MKKIFGIIAFALFILLGCSKDSEDKKNPVFDYTINNIGDISIEQNSFKNVSYEVKLTSGIAQDVSL